ncbi:hypothetical protein QFC24_004401 [Naganishia onofrii]|uniref:Uncharacterized protein n=1 Tax=Naganishia onofrii TaxID=1851511 RepID=A0ACC2XFY2_9TREE|nr:hypothetical protein QFC24_004401 [Naganishia onofrii]
MVVAEFDSASDTNPHVVAGSAPLGEASHQTTTDHETSEAAINKEITSAINGNASANGNGIPDIKFVQRVGNIPIVADGIGTFESVVNSTNITASMYSTASAIAAKSLDVASPIIARTGPLISKADDLANQGLDMVESRFPSAFKATSNDVLESAKQPAAQGMAVAKGVYDGQIAPILHNEIVARAIEQLSNINRLLADGVNSIKDRVFATTHNASEQAHDLTAKLADQLHALQTQGKDLPPIIRDSMTTAYTDVRKIMGDQEKTTQQKATDIAHYVQSIIQPELDKAQALLFKKKDEVADVAEDAEAKAKDAAADVQEQAEKTSQAAGEAVQDAADDVKAAAQ